MLSNCYTDLLKKQVLAISKDVFYERLGIKQKFVNMLKGQKCEDKTTTSIFYWPFF